MDAPVGWSCERGAVGRYGGVGRLAAAPEVTVGITSVRDAGVPRGLSPAAATRDCASDSAAPGAPARSPEASGASQATSRPRSPRGRCTADGALGGSARGATSGASRPRASGRRGGGPRRSEFRLFVTPSSPVCVPQPGLLSGGVSLHFVSLELTVSVFTLLASGFLDPASAARVQGPDVTLAS